MVVYILKSEITERYYVGITDNLDDRLQRHNEGRSKATKHGAPWKLVTFFEVEDRSEAMKLETKIKKQGARRFLERNNENGSNA
jgi:putative endonuclease